MRRCAKCTQTKPLEEFYSDRNRPQGKSYLCKPCSIAKKRNNEIRKNYGITELQFQEMWKSQDEKCAICNATETGISRTNRFSIDHCHKTGLVRGLLCNWCNQGLGMFRDNPELLLKASKYLKKEKI